MLWKVKKNFFFKAILPFIILYVQVLFSVTVLKSMFLRRNQIDIIVS